ncbi:MAG TPA: hypothetical protein VGZ90_13530 [Puia sp.]|jgi:hypothetical protein|nr:hypothetical protein [Puia sp.]
MKSKQGGKRKGSGRKPIADKKIQISVYPRQSSIMRAGGIEASKLLALNAIEQI